MAKFHELIVNSEEEMNNFARKVAEVVKKGDVIALNGNLGVGKTVFSRSFVKYLTAEDQIVVSPTFTLVQIYDAPKFQIWHFDLYRLKDETDLYEVGIEEALINGVSLIEWPSLALNFIKDENLINIKIEMIDEHKRHITVKGIEESRLK
ncbi:MAG: tRNA threonylcarbamoyladenosine biosynthesis protein TsaE [Alphaproteobacteria bacterium ADurb.Bin438]|nr:MAG: tRNA threonylcarbamoyladenosine biosynthesis protein TsaE [Alphaproteobacteria bacterium ADurb.Bin438]